MHLESPKIKNKVGLAEFAAQSVAAAVGLLDEKQKKRFNVSIDCPTRDSILVQHTHLSQIVVNGKFVVMGRCSGTSDSSVHV